MLTDKERNEIDPEFCCRHLLGISSRLTNELRRDEHAAIFGAVSLIKDQSVDEWCFGIKQRRNWTTDKEKVINALERCESYGYCQDTDCPYYENTHCLELLRKDALILLKEYKPVKPKSKVRHGAYGQIQHFCGNCNAMLHGKQKYCSECGKEVKWDG